MNPRTRLLLAAFIVVGSSFYGVLVAKDILTGIAVALGYIAVVLTLLVANEVWKRHDDDC